jgi:hypothetical protein
MNRFLILMSALLLVSAFVAAQDAEPEEPGIVLPPTLLEVADLQVEEISAIVPDDDVQLLPELIIPLPKADEIFLPEEKFDIPYPDQLEGGQVGIVYRPERRADIFSEGEIAVGSMNHVHGDLNLYRLGPDPRFDLLFFHDKIDGYGLRSAGSGFFHSSDRLEGSLSIDTNGAEIDTAAGITESSEGLQGVGDFEVLTYREVYGDAQAAYPLTETIGLHGTLTSSYAQQILSSASPSIKAEIGAGALVGIDLETRVAGFGASLAYGFLDAISPAHHLDLELLSDVPLTDAFSLDLAVGVVWDPSIDFRYPFSVGALYQPSDLFAVSAAGGYFVRFPTVGGLRPDYRFVELDATLGPEYGWFAETEVQSRPARTVNLFGGLKFEYLDSGYILSSTMTESTGLFPLIRTTGAEDPRLEAEIGLDVEIGKSFAMSAGWIGRFLGDHPYEADHVFTTALNFSGAGDTFGGEILAEIPLTNPMQIPTLSLSGYYRISESVRFSLDVADPLAPILEDGRPFWGPYEAPGFRFSLATNISL